MNDSQVAIYRALIRKMCDEMIGATHIWDRTDITRDEKIRLFNEAQILIGEYERDAHDYMDSVIAEWPEIRLHK